MPVILLGMHFSNCNHTAFILATLLWATLLSSPLVCPFTTRRSTGMRLRFARRETDSCRNGHIWVGLQPAECRCPKKIVSKFPGTAQRSWLDSFLLEVCLPSALRASYSAEDKLFSLSRECLTVGQHICLHSRSKASLAPVAAFPRWQHKNPSPPSLLLIPLTRRAKCYTPLHYQRLWY